MFDSHCHLHDDAVRGDVDEIVARARAMGITGYLLAGVHPDGWKHELEIANAHSEVRIAYGVHPQIMSDDARGMVDALGVALDGGMPRPAAVGEIGLDGSDAYVDTLPLQEELFVRQLRLAQQHDLPVLLHVLKAHPRALELLAAHPVRGVLHSCSASVDLVQRYLALGFFISFAGTVTNPRARRIRASAASVPLEQLLVETDAPFQTPIALRPARNEPAFLVEIVRALAQIRGTTEAAIADATTYNAHRLLRSRERA
ncbi:MAG: TatD family hydrolase [Polyangia bacterium]